jgi:diketogulonate reductase-like aldo/keto reductase
MLTDPADFCKSELETLLPACRIPPALHQFERHPYLPQNAFVAYHQQIGLHISAYTPLGNTNPSFADHDTLPPILENHAVKALAKKHGVSPASILISLQLSVSPSLVGEACGSAGCVLTPQQGHSALPKSITPSRIEDNLKVVKLSVNEIAQIAEATTGQRARYADFSEISEYWAEIRSGP